MSIVISGTTGIDAGSLPVSNCGNTEVEGNLNLSGVGARITGDFSNATYSNRIAFQTNAPNTYTTVAAIPNGTGAYASFQCYSSSDMNNSTRLHMGASTNLVEISSSPVGTASYVPLIFTTGGSERMRIDTAGNVGIGTNNPVTKLTVNHSVNAGEAVRIGNSVGGSGSVQGSTYIGLNHWGVTDTLFSSALIGVIEDGTSSYNASVIFSTRGSGTDSLATERMRIDSAGNVGIGVTPSAWGSGFNAIEGNSGSIVYRSSNSGLELWQNAYFSSGENAYKATAAASRYAQQGGKHTWFTAPSGTAGNTITWTNAMTLDTSTYNNTTTLILDNPTNASRIDLKSQGTRRYSISTDINSGLYFTNSAGTTAMTLDASGNLLLQSGTGGLGYGTGAGGTVTQLTSKSTAVTLNKPCGQITTSNSSLASNASVVFQFNNSILDGNSVLLLSGYAYAMLQNYAIASRVIGNAAEIKITNISASTLSDVLMINFSVIKGAQA